MRLILCFILRRIRVATLIEQMDAPLLRRRVCSTTWSKGVPPVAGSVRPGLHMPVRDGPNVVWWDASALALEVEDHAALRHQRILEVDPDKLCRCRKRARLRRVEEGADRSTQPGLPALDLRPDGHRARSLGSIPRFRGSLVCSESRGSSAADFERPSGRRFGSLVHAILASVSRDADANPIGARPPSMEGLSERPKRR